MRKELSKSRKQRSRVAPPAHEATNSKAEAERAKLSFGHKAESLGFGVYETVGENPPYDFIIDNGPDLLRVQVKAMQSVADLNHLDLGPINSDRRGFKPRTGCRGRNDQLYTANETDFVAAYIVPEDTWYIIPISPKAVANAELSG
jgi:PD-(D/E)XK nuclease superfamily protein